jgi:hypothetical protein
MSKNRRPDLNDEFLNPRERAKYKGPVTTIRVSKNDNDLQYYKASKQPLPPLKITQQKRDSVIQVPLPPPPRLRKSSTIRAVKYDNDNHRYSMMVNQGTMIRDNIEVEDDLPSHRPNTVMSMRDDRKPSVTEEQMKKLNNRRATPYFKSNLIEDGEDDSELKRNTELNKKIAVSNSQPKRVNISVGILKTDNFTKASSKFKYSSSFAYGLCDCCEDFHLCFLSMFCLPW